jgi:hypothetical protein
LESEKNKYVVMDDTCTYTTADQAFDTADQKTVILEACRTENEKTVKLPEIETMEEALKDQKTVLLDAEFESFLRQNRDFWYMTKETFEVRKTSSKTLKDKK